MEEWPWHYVCEVCDEIIEVGEEYVDIWRGNSHTWRHAKCSSSTET